MELFKLGIEKLRIWINEVLESNFVQSIKLRTKTLGTWFSKVFASASQSIKLRTKTLGTWFHKVFSSAVQSIKHHTKTLRTRVPEVFASAVQSIKLRTKTLGTWFSKVFASAVQSIKHHTKTLGTWSSKVFASAVRSIKHNTKTLRTRVPEVFTSAVQSIKHHTKTLGTWFSKVFTRAVQSIKHNTKTLGTWFSKVFDNAVQSIKLSIKKLGTMFNKMLSGASQLLEHSIQSLGKLFSKVIRSGGFQAIKHRTKTLGVLFFESVKTKKIFRNGLITITVLALLLINPFDTSFAKSMNKQEFFLYHVKDLLQNSFGEKAAAEPGCYLATDTYEKQLDGELFGVGKEKNLIVVQMESLQSMVIDADYNGQEITPVFNKLISENGSVYFDNFYCQLGAGNTSDAEFAVNNSLFGSIESYTYQLFEDNYFYGLPKVMIDEGYGTAAFHGYKKEFWNRENIYPSIGFQRFYSSEDYESDNISGIGGGNIVGISDEAFFQQTVDKMLLLEQPYYGFVITLSNHNPFGLPEYLKKIKLEEKDENIFGNYLNAAHYGDYCLGEFMEAMKEKGLYENSIFVFYGDHYGLTKSDSKISNSVSEWLGEEYTYDEMNRVPMLVHIPGSQLNETVSVSGGQMDLFPTISYLMGIKELKTLYLGQNLFAAEVGFVPIQMHMLKGSFIMDDVVFQMSRDGIFKNSKAWNRITKEPLDPESYYVEYKAAKQAVETSEFYLYNDILNKVLIEGKDLNSIINSNEIRNPLPKELSLYSFKRDSDEEIDYMAQFLKFNKKDYLAISSNNIYAVLSKFEELYSGKRGVTGSILYVDETANEEFLDMRSRIVPVMNESTNNYSKLEYLGYHNIIISPERSGMTADELRLFVESNDVAGFLLEDKNPGQFLDLADNNDVDVYELKNGFLKKQ